LKPECFLFENVPGLISGDNLEYARWLATELQDSISQDHYGVAIGLFNAADFGVPQKRRRIVIVGIRNTSSADVHHFFDNVHLRRNYADSSRLLEPGKRPWQSIASSIPDWDNPGLGWRRWIDIPDKLHQK